MAGNKRTRPVLSSEDWLKRYKIAFFIAVTVMAVLMVLVFMEYRADMIELQAVQKMIQDNMPAEAAMTQGGAV